MRCARAMACRSFWGFQSLCNGVKHVRNTFGTTYIKDNNRVGCFKVDPQATRTRTQQEREVGAAGHVEVRHGLLARVARDGAVEALMDITAKRHVVAKDIQHAHHLAEDEHAMAILPQAREQLVQQDHLPAVHNEALERRLVVVAAELGAVEQEGVVSGLLKLHDDVEQRDIAVAVGAPDEALEVLGRR